MFKKLFVAFTLSAALFTTRAADTQDSAMLSVGTGIHLLSNNLLTDYNRLQFGGTSASFPALKRSGATLQVKTASDSAYADIKARTLLLDTTLVTVGTTNVQTINKGSGRINIQAGQGSIVVSNSLVTATSYVIAQNQTADATGRVTAVVPAAGYFTIHTETNTTEAAVAFIVINP